MDRQHFLIELNKLKTEHQSLNGASVCSRLYSALTDCLAVESKSVEAKLQVLTAALTYYAELRTNFDNGSHDADSLGHHLFIECSRVVLGIEFHNLLNDDPFKVALKEAIMTVRDKLATYAVCQVFHILDWLLVNQWSHPTLVAMMRGEDVERESGLAYVSGGEYPDLLRLRIQMLMESGCENYSLNLISWCVQSPIFEADVTIRTMHLSLLHRLGRTEEFHNQCCQIRCCLARDILRHIMSRGSIEDQSFLLLLSQTFLVLNWMKPMQFCCLQELLESWLRVQRSVESETNQFLDNVRKVASLTQDLRQIALLLDVLTSLFGIEFISFCTELVVMMIRREISRVCHHGSVSTNTTCCHSSDIEQATATNLAQICRVTARLYEQNPHMRLACLLTAFSLDPTDTQYYQIESCFLSDITAGVPLAPPANVDVQLYVLLLESLCQLRVPSLDPRLNWNWNCGVKQAALRRFEETGRSLPSEEKQANEVDGLGLSRRVDLGISQSSPSLTTTHASNLTLDDIQQVLSCPRVNEVVTNSNVDGSNGTGGTSEAAIDERALREITAYLQSEVGSGKVAQDAVLLGRGSNDISSTAIPQMPMVSTQSQGHDSNVVVRFLQQPNSVEHVQRSRESATPSAVTPSDVGGTILVTESNLPYLQQFLPNLQTVMQSVQSLVRSAPPPPTQPPVADLHSTSLTNCGPRLVATLPQFPVVVNAPGVVEGQVKEVSESKSSLKKRKRNSNAKSDSSVMVTLNDSATTPTKSAETTKLCEPDSASSINEGAFTCDQCSRSFSKRLGLSVHVQRAHGHRQKAETTDTTNDTTKSHLAGSTLGNDTPNVKNCFMKVPQPHLGDETSQLKVKMAVDNMPVQQSPGMCDSCGEFVNGMDAHALVCGGKRSPVKVAQHAIGGPSGGPAPAVSVKPEPASASVPTGVNPGAVIEMLQLAEHFLRQNVPSSSSTVPASTAVSDQKPQSQFHQNTVAERCLRMPSPPPYREISDIRMPYVLPTMSGTSNAAGHTNGEMCSAAVEDQMQNMASPSRPPGKEIIYEGTRMREFVEFQCDACLLTFVTSLSANTHVADHHSSASVSAYRVYACTSCALRYRDPRIMRHHVVYLCAGGSQLPSNQPSQTQSKLHICSLCPKTFVSQDYLDLHVRVRHGGNVSSSTPGIVQCVLPAPPGVPSVPTLDQLMSQCRQRQLQPGVMDTVSQSQISQVQAPSLNSSEMKSEGHNDSFHSVDDRLLSSVPHSSPETPDSLSCNRANELLRSKATAASVEHSVGDGAVVKGRSSRPKGIVYKNVFMQCEGTYFCSECKADLTGREAKRQHRQLPCGDPKTASYSRRYTYLCPYCTERFPSQKLCRQHQIDKCLPQTGVPITAEADLGIGEHRCLLCPKICYGYAELKKHMTQIHLPNLKGSRAANVEQELNFMQPENGSAEQEYNGVISPRSHIGNPPSNFSSGMPLNFIEQAPTPPSAVNALCDGTNNLNNCDDIEHDEELSDSVKSSAALPLSSFDLAESLIQGSNSLNSEDSSRPKRNRSKSKTAGSGFFVMMFRNYPILAKGVSMCRSCSTQLEISDTVEMHAPVCTGSAPAEVRRSTLFRCTHCPKTFWHAKDCRVHQIEYCLPAHGIDAGQLTEPSVACPICNVRSYNRSGLMSHMKFRHKLDTDGVRQVMDRYGIKKSIPPPPSTTEEVKVPTSASSNESMLMFNDGSHSFDDIASHGISESCEDEISSQLSSSVGKADMSFHCTPSTPDNLVNCISNSTISNDLLSVSNGEAAADLDVGASWQTALV